MTLSLLLSMALAQGVVQGPSGIRLSDEGVARGQILALDCVGTGITCTKNAATGVIAVSAPDAGASGGHVIKDETASLPAQPSLNFTGAGVTCTNNGGTSSTDCSIPGGAGVDLSGETFITQTASGNLSAEQALGVLGTGILKNTTTTGVLSIAVAGDFPTLNQNTTGTAAALAADPADCAVNTFATTIAANGALTCAQVATSQLSGTVSIAQGGTTETASTEDAVLVGAGTTDWAPKVLPSCSGGLSALTYNVSTNAFGCNTITTPPAYEYVWDEGSPLTQQSRIDFVGPAVTATDNGGAGSTEVTIVASGTGACGANNWVYGLNDGAAPDCSQPGFGNLSGAVSIAQGGTTETAATEDAVLVGSSTTDWQPKVLPSCSNATTSKLLYDNSTNTFSCGTDQSGGGGGGTSPLILSFGGF